MSTHVTISLHIYENLWQMEIFLVLGRIFKALKWFLLWCVILKTSFMEKTLEQNEKFKKRLFTHISKRSLQFWIDWYPKKWNKTGRDLDCPKKRKSTQNCWDGVFTNFDSFQHAVLTYSILWTRCSYVRTFVHLHSILQ